MPSSETREGCPSSVEGRHRIPAVDVRLCRLCENRIDHDIFSKITCECEPMSATAVARLSLVRHRQSLMRPQREARSASRAANSG